jgi:hypothetical protein
MAPAPARVIGVGVVCVAVSIIVATLALNDLLSRHSRPRTRH